MARRRSRNPRPTNPRKRGRPSPSAAVAAAADSDSDSDFALSSDHSDIDLEEFLQVPVIPQIPRQVPKPPRRRSRNPPPRRRDPEVVLKWEVLEDQNDKWIADHRFDSPEDDVTAAGNITAEPSAVITLPLLRFQKEFLFWALNQERSDVRGGILADEMGMGKTIQAISMVLTARDNWQKSRILESSSSSSSSLPVVGATLVICPVVAVIQWAGEIERYTEKGSVRVLIYHGANRAKCEYDFDKYDFVVTTYQTIEYDYRKNVMPLGEKCMYCGRRFKKRSLKIHLRYHCGPGAKKTEKQAKTKKKGGEGKGKAKKGKEKEKEKEKEVDDGVEDVGDGVRGVSLLHSVKWERIILDEAHFIKDRNSNTARAIFALQSRYKWALSGTPLQNRVGELYSLVRFLQAYPYANYFCKDCDCSIFDHTASDSGTCFSCPHSITRHFCWWNRYVNKPIQSGITYDSEGAMIFLRRKILKSIVLRRTKKGRAADLALPPRIVTLRKDYLDKGENEIYEALYTQSRVEFDTYVVAGTLMNNYAHIFDLLTRLRQAVDHPYLVICSKTAGLQNEDQADNVKDNCGICHEAAEDEVVTSCEHVFCKACLLDYSAVLGNVSCPSCAKTLTVDLTTNMSGEKNYSATPIKGYKRSGILNRVKLSEFKTSTKIDALREEIRNMVESDGSAKGIVFSQFTSFLDLINYSLEMSGIKCVQLVGSMSLAEREKAINTFTENSDCRIFLMSLRAGGVALNLTVASHVFLMDPWWNPAVESQAQDRIHRIGQFKPIRIVRFVIENTIEERILKLQEKKQLVFEGTVGNSADAMSKLTEADLRFLFQ